MEDFKISNFLKFGAQATIAYFCALLLLNTLFFLEYDYDPLKVYEGDIALRVLTLTIIGSVCVVLGFLTSFILFIWDVMTAIVFINSHFKESEEEKKEEEARQEEFIVRRNIRREESRQLLEFNKMTEKRRKIDP